MLREKAAKPSLSKALAIQIDHPLENHTALCIDRVQQSSPNGSVVIACIASARLKCLGARLIKGAKFKNWKGPYILQPSSQALIRLAELI